MHQFNRDKMNELGFTPSHIDFLADHGLPKSAAPFLSFGSEDDLKTLEEVYSIIDSIAKNKIHIGSDGEGNPICIDLENTSRVVICDHENNFLPKFMNSSVLELFNFLKVMKEFIDHIISKNGEDAFFDCKFSDNDFSELKSKFEQIDKDALVENTFWCEELGSLLADREFYQGNSK